MTPTKIKARKMWAEPNWQSEEFASYTVQVGRGTRHSAPVYVLDASRYGEMVEQMAKAMYARAAIAPCWKAEVESCKNFYRLQARAALRSIGITKGAK